MGAVTTCVYLALPSVYPPKVIYMVPLGRIGYSGGEWMITTIVFGFNNTGIFAYLKGLTDDSPLGF